MRAAFLIRCSTDKQDYARQERDLTKLAQRLGFEKSVTYGENYTGRDDFTIGDRESIKELKEGAAKHEYDVLLVSEVSRLSRDIASGAAYVRQLTNMNIPIYFKDIDTWTIDPNTGHKQPEAELIIVNAFMAAWKYIRSMKTQIASGRRNELENNQVSVGRPFFGYKRTQSKNRDEKNRIVVDETLAPIVRDVFETYLQDGATLKSTALAMTDKYKDVVGKNFTISTIEHILTYEPYCTGIMPIYLGDPDDPNFVESRKKNKYDKTYQERFDVEIPQLIERELWERARDKRKHNKVSSDPYPKQKTHLLSKLLKCPCCGYTMSPRKKATERKGEDGKFVMRQINGADALSWICMSGVNNATDCKNRISVANEKLEPIIWGLIQRELIGYSNIFNNDREQRIERLKAKFANLDNEVIHLENDIEEQQKKINRAVDMVMKANDDILPMITERCNEITITSKRKIEDDTAKIAACKTEMATIDKQLSILEKPVTDEEIRDKANADPMLKRKLVKELIQKIVPYQITTYKSRVVDKRGKLRYERELKHGVVLLEVHTVFGVYNILYNSNANGDIREAYYMSEVFATYQNGDNAFEIYPKGEYFVIQFPDMVGDGDGDLEAFLNMNEFVEKCKLNMWILQYDYKTGEYIERVGGGFPYDDLKGFEPPTDNDNN